MNITTITITYELRQNLGDYSGVKLAETLTAAVDEGEDAEDVRTDLLAMAQAQVQNAVNDALEQNGREVIYYAGPLYRVFSSDIRKCVVILPAAIEPPKEENWKERDYWSQVAMPRDKRPELARQVFESFASHRPDMVGVSCVDGDLSRIPPLPDPGPEPLWHAKNLQDRLNDMSIPHALWDELAGLEHVTAEFLEQVYRETHSYGGGVRPRSLEIIRSGVLPEPELEPEDEDEDFDEEDGEEETSF